MILQILPALLITSLVTAQSDEFLRLKKELDDRIAALRPEAREVAERLKSVFEARLPKDEAKARLNAVLESASDSAKAALDTLRPDHKIDVELVIPLPEETASVIDCDVDRVLSRFNVPDIDRITAAVDRHNLTDKTVSEALRASPNLAAQLGVDRTVLDKIDNLAAERGLSNYSVDTVLQMLRHNISAVLNAEERDCLEKHAYARNFTSVEQLFGARLGAGPRPKPPGPGDVGGKIRNATDDLIDDFMGGRHNRSGDFVDDFLGGRHNRSGDHADRLFNGTDGGHFVEKIKERFGNDSSILGKFFSNATGEFEGFGNVSDKTIQKLLDGLKSGNSSIIDRLFSGNNGTGDGTVNKIKDALKNNNLAALIGGSGWGSGMLEKIKAMFNNTLPGSGGSSSESSSGNNLSNLGTVFTNLTSSFKNLLG